jgi:hypothetical protein
MRDILQSRVLAIVFLAFGLVAGSFSVAGAQDDDMDGGTPIVGDEPGSIVISNFVCTQIDEPTMITEPVGVDTAASVPDEEGCVESSANFEIYVNGDFTSEPIEVFVDGTATVNGIPATAEGTPHALLETSFNVFFEFEIAPGGVTTITVLNPADVGDGATPANDGDDDGTDDGTADDGADDGAVSGLPSTGQGSDGGANGTAIVLLFGAMSMVALAAGFAWRQRRSA